MPQSVINRLTSRAEKALRQRSKWRQRFHRRTWTSSPKFQTSMLHFKPFGKTFNPEFLKSPFSETVKIKIVISLVITSGNIYFDFTEKSQHFIGKHIRNIVFAWVVCQSVCLSVCPSVCLSVTKSCPLCNLKTVQDIFMKLHTNINQH